MDQEKSYIEEYEIHQMIGDGGQAQVYLVSKDDQLYAAKVYAAGESKKLLFEKQAQYLQKLKSPYLINIIESKANAKVKLAGQEEMMRNVIILEYAQGGQMFGMIQKQGSFSPNTCKHIFNQLVEVMDLLHSEGICHRDLKPDNLLFDCHFNLKVADFGLATQIQGDNGDGILLSKVGTEGFRSPEMEQGKYQGRNADIFAAGVILFLMYSGSLPFISTRISDKIYKLIRQGNYEKFWDLHEKKRGSGFYCPEVKKLLNSLFSSNPHERPTIEDLQTCQWLQTQQQPNTKQQLGQKFQNIIDEDPQKQELNSFIEKFKSWQYQENTKKSSQTTI